MEGWKRGVERGSGEGLEKGGEHEGGERGLGVLWSQKPGLPCPYGLGAALQVYGPQEGSWL